MCSRTGTCHSQLGDLPGSELAPTLSALSGGLVHCPQFSWGRLYSIIGKAVESNDLSQQPNWFLLPQMFLRLLPTCPPPPQHGQWMPENLFFRVESESLEGKKRLSSLDSNALFRTSQIRPVAPTGIMSQYRLQSIWSNTPHAPFHLQSLTYPHIRFSPSGGWLSVNDTHMSTVTPAQNLPPTTSLSLWIFISMKQRKLGHSKDLTSLAHMLSVFGVTQDNQRKTLQDVLWLLLGGGS